MQLIPPGQPLLLPNICTICEQWTNPDAGLPTIDTEREFEVGVITKLTGRKYVCHGCVDDMARTLGYVDGALYEQAVNDLEERQVRLARIEATSGALLQATALQAALADLLPSLDEITDDLAAITGGADVPAE